MKKSKTILFRKSLTPKEEIDAAIKAGFDVSFSRVGILDKTVIGRYACLPFYQELYEDLKIQNSYLLNSTLEHQYIANFDYYFDLENLTPRTYFSTNIPEGQYIVKGKTNSKKSKWNSAMFAENKEKALKIYEDLSKDSLIGDQGIIFREFVPLKTLEIGINEQPFANEWRFFFLKEKIVDFGFYWSQSSQIPDKNSLLQEAIDFAQKCANILSKNTTFFVIDIAETVHGEWILIEVNDGQQSGLSEIDPFQFYQNLYKISF